MKIGRLKTPWVRSTLLKLCEAKKLLSTSGPHGAPPARKNYPLSKFFSDLQDPNKVTVTTINVKEPPSRAFRFMQNNQITLPLVSDPQGEIAQKFGVTVFPTTLLIDSTGQIKWRIVGEVDWTAAEAQAWLYSLR